MCSLSAGPRILFEKSELFVDDSEAPLPHPFVYVDDCASPPTSPSHDLPSTPEGLGLVPPIQLEECAPEPPRIPSAPVTSRIQFEKSKLSVDEVEAPLPHPFDYVEENSFRQPFKGEERALEYERLSVIRGLLNGISVAGLARLINLLGIARSIVTPRVTFKKCELEVDENEAPPPDPFDYVDDSKSLPSTNEPQDFPGTTEGLGLGLVPSIKVEECAPKPPRIPSAPDGLPNGMNVQDLSEIIDLLDIGIGRATPQIIFKKCELEVDDDEAPPPEPFDLVEQCHGRENSGYGTNRTKMGAPSLGKDSDGHVAEAGKHKGTSGESGEA